MNVNTPEIRDHILDYLESNHLIASYGHLAGVPAAEEVVLDLDVIKETEEGVFVDCHFHFNELVRVGPKGASHKIHRNGLVHVRLDPENGTVQDAWLR